jgi:threonine/homoserine/homoserine lactone efflux protein
VLGYFAFEAFRDARTVTLAQLRDGAAHAPSVRHALRQGVIANALNPSPWMFWITIGAPLLRGSWSEGPLVSASFLVGFYALLIGAKLAMAGAVGAGRSRLSDVDYRRILTAAGMLLVGLALSLVRSGVHALA